mmetsp:Transcript_22058/g.33703  ORF Transcript_22058/g.33703 Transcript_22058/m.33703 type:complete len:435 (-) Transcript_22058:1015-2319(-)
MTFRTTPERGRWRAVRSVRATWCQDPITAGSNGPQALTSVCTVSGRSSSKRYSPGSRAEKLQRRMDSVSVACASTRMDPDAADLRLIHISIHRTLMLVAAWHQSGSGTDSTSSTPSSTISLSLAEVLCSAAATSRSHTSSRTVRSPVIPAVQAPATNTRPCLALSVGPRMAKLAWIRHRGRMFSLSGINFLQTKEERDNDHTSVFCHSIVSRRLPGSKQGMSEVFPALTPPNTYSSLPVATDAGNRSPPGLCGGAGSCAVHACSGPYTHLHSRDPRSITQVSISDPPYASTPNAITSLDPPCSAATCPIRAAGRSPAVRSRVQPWTRWNLKSCPPSVESYILPPKSIAAPPVGETVVKETAGEKADDSWRVHSSVNRFKTQVSSSTEAVPSPARPCPPWMKSWKLISQVEWKLRDGGGGFTAHTCSQALTAGSR